MSAASAGPAHGPQDGYDGFELHRLSLLTTKQSNSIQNMEKDLLAIKSQDHRICDLQQKVEQLQKHASMSEYIKAHSGDLEQGTDQNTQEMDDLKAHIMKIEEHIEDQRNTILNMEVHMESASKIMGAVGEIENATKQCASKIDALSTSSASINQVDNLQMGAQLHSSQIQDLQVQISELQSTMSGLIASKHVVSDIELRLGALSETVDSLSDSTSLIADLAMLSNDHTQSIDNISMQIQNLWDQKIDVTDKTSPIEDLRDSMKKTEGNLNQKIEKVEVDITQSMHSMMSGELGELTSKIDILSNRKVPELSDYEELALRVDGLCSNRVHPSDFDDLKQLVDSLSHMAVDSVEIAALKASLSEMCMQNNDATLLETLTEKVASCEDRLMSRVLEEKELHKQLLSEVVEQRVGALTERTEEMYSSCVKEQDMLKISQKVNDIEGQLVTDLGCTESDVKSIVMEYGQQKALAAIEKSNGLSQRVDELQIVQQQIQQETKAQMEELKLVDDDKTQRLKTLEASVGLSYSECKPKFTESLFSRISTIADKVEESCTSIEAISQEAILTRGAFEEVKDHDSRLQVLEEHLEAIRDKPSVTPSHSMCSDTNEKIKSHDRAQSCESTSKDPAETKKEENGENDDEGHLQQASQQEILALVAAIHNVPQCTQYSDSQRKEVIMPLSSSCTKILPFEAMESSNQMPNTGSSVRQFLEWLYLVNKERDELMTTTCRKIEEIEYAIGEQAKTLVVIKEQQNSNNALDVRNSLSGFQCELETQGEELQALKNAACRWMGDGKDLSVAHCSLESTAIIVEKTLGQDSLTLCDSTQLNQQDGNSDVALHGTRSGSSEVKSPNISYSIY